MTVALDHRSYVGNPDDWVPAAVEQIGFFRAHGLEPQHNFLDIGCGPLRGGAQFIAYLDKGRYHGIEMSREVLEAGLENEINQLLIADKEPRFCINKNFLVVGFYANFDFINAYQLFQHCTTEQLRQCFAQVRDVLKPEGKFFFSLLFGPEVAGRPWSDGITDLPYPKSVRHSMHTMRAVAPGFDIQWESTTEPHRWCSATLTTAPAAQGEPREDNHHVT